MTDTLDMDIEELEKLKKAYAKAVDDGDGTFTFQGKELVVGYAKYLIEYLEGELDG